MKFPPPALLAVLMVSLAGCGGAENSAVGPSPLKVAAGVIDRSFGQDGVASVAGTAIESQHSAGFASAQDAAGRIWSTGQLAATADVLATPSVTLVSRFLPNGFIDITLQGTAFVQGPRLAGASAWGTAIALASNGASIVEFERDACGATCPPFTAFVARHLLSNGPFDAGFGNAGSAPLEIRVSDVLPDSDGALLLFGRVIVNETTALPMARRIDAAGRLDAAYAANATNALDCGDAPNAFASDVKAARLPGGNVLAAVVNRIAPFTLDNLCLVRLKPDGTLDLSYGNQGRLKVVDASFDFNSPVAVLVRPDGSAVIPLQVTVPLPPVNGNPCPPGGISARLFWATSDGRQDTTRPSNIPSLISLTAAAIQPDGRILLAGYAAGSCGLDLANPTLERLAVDGTIDTGFGAAATGRVTLAPGNRALVPNHVLVGSEGAIYVTGAWRTGSADGSPSQLAVVRLGS